MAFIENQWAKPGGQTLHNDMEYSIVSFNVIPVHLASLK